MSCPRNIPQHRGYTPPPFLHQKVEHAGALREQFNFHRIGVVVRLEGAWRTIVKVTHNLRGHIQLHTVPYRRVRR